MAEFDRENWNYPITTPTPSLKEEGNLDLTSPHFQGGVGGGYRIVPI